MILQYWLPSVPIELSAISEIFYCNILQIRFKEVLTLSESAILIAPSVPIELSTISENFNCNLWLPRFKVVRQVLNLNESAILIAPSVPIELSAISEIFNCNLLLVRFQVVRQVCNFEWFCNTDCSFCFEMFTYGIRIKQK